MNGWLFDEEEIGKHPALIGREQKFSDYAAFTEKFKGKKTTDDCYTPSAVYEAVKKWVSDNVLNLDGVEIVRPFYPGGDYESFQYPANCVVLDNPPFSQLAKIRRFYAARGIRYFLFAPTLTLFSTVLDGECFIVCGGEIVYENGAKVPTSFITNIIFENIKVYICAYLTSSIKEANRCSIRMKGKKVANLGYPSCVITAALVQGAAKDGVEMKIKASSLHHCKGLDELKKDGKGLFGGGFLLSERIARELSQARRKAREEERLRVYEREKEREKERERNKKYYSLSSREKEIQRGLI